MTIGNDIDVLRKQLEQKELAQSKALKAEAEIFIASYLKFSKISKDKEGKRQFANLDYNKLKEARVEGIKVNSSWNGINLEIV